MIKIIHVPNILKAIIFVSYFHDSDVSKIIPRNVKFDTCSIVIEQ